MKYLQGISGSQGICKGKAVFYKKNILNAECNIDIDEAVLKAVNEIDNIKLKNSGILNNEDLEIFEAYKMILNDSMFIGPIKEMIENGINPYSAIKNHSEEISSKIAQSKSEYLRERANDILYVGDILANTITDNKSTSVNYKHDKIILIAEELSPVDIMNFDKKKIAGIATQKGGSTSHTVIIAKSLGIPIVVGLDGYDNKYEDENCILDAEKGILIIDPDESTKNEYNTEIDKEKRKLKEINDINGKKAKSVDGIEFNVFSNVGGFADVKSNYEIILEGVGLLRTEFMYSAHEKKPDFSYQVNEYKKIFEYFADGLVTIRMIDVGGDKKIKYIDVGKEENPFLGNRGVRLYYNYKDLILEQIEAILKASDGKTVRLLVPMISVVEEIIYFKSLVFDVLEKLRAETDFKEPEILIGIMLETPSAVLNCENLSKYCDFFSIGTNDLTQYLLCADRGNENVSGLYSYCYPVILKTLYDIIKVCEKNNVYLSVCGDIASDENMVPALAVLGIRNFSVPVPVVNKIKYILTKINVKSYREFSDKLLVCQTKKETEELIYKLNKTIFN